ncbi:MAG TPA: hypothetical protein VLV86_07410 [Vicinamibacterales bacterium]|nr:hypothetical protein [Vicinamibacterales bacterium]
MARNILRRIVTIVALMTGLVVGMASNGAAQIFPPKRPIPIPLPLLPALLEITAGDQHTCVRKHDGTVYCWGDDALGQVGPSTTTCKANGTLIATEPCVDTPTYVTQLSTIASQIVAGASHTCALNAGFAECWGSNLFGELGNNASGIGTQQTLPQNVLNSPLFTVLAAGPNVTCGLSQTGIFCWGQGPLRSLASSVSKPTLVEATYTSSGFYSSLTVGKQFACFNSTASLFNENDCQGIDNDDQLGIPHNPAPFVMPIDTGFGHTGQPFIDFLWASSLSPVLRASAGLDYVCADMTNGTVQCVGNNLNGKLGSGLNNATNPNATPVVSSSGSLLLHGVTSGLSHACALDSGGNAWCWGLNQSGELGTGSTASGSSNFAQPVSGGHTFRMLAAGAHHTCGIGTDDYVYCWGDNEFGQLGIGKNALPSPNGFGSATSTGTPQQVPAF